MSKLTSNILGIEVSKDRLKTVLICGNETFFKQFENSPTGFQLLQASIDFLEMENVHACLGGIENHFKEIADFLFERSHTVSFVSQKQLLNFIKTKTESYVSEDNASQYLADYCQTQNPSPWIYENNEITQMQAAESRLNIRENEPAWANWAFST